MKTITKKTKISLLSLALIILIVAVGIVTAANRKNSAPRLAIIASDAVPKIKIKISEDGFEPATLKIKTGTTVTWVNEDTEPHRVAANPYPSHKELPQLDSRTNVSTNGTYKFTFTKSGTFRYHDELNPTVNGTIIVQ